MKATDEELVQFIRDSSEPVLTSKEVAEEFGLRRQSAHDRLLELHDDGRIQRKQVGPSVVWYLDT